MDLNKGEFISSFKADDINVEAYLNNNQIGFYFNNGNYFWNIDEISKTAYWKISKLAQDSLTSFARQYIIDKILNEDKE